MRINKMSQAAKMKNFFAALDARPAKPGIYRRVA